MGGFASSRILEIHGERMIKRTFDPGFRIELHQKDLNLALQGARPQPVIAEYGDNAGAVQRRRRARRQRLGAFGTGAGARAPGRAPGREVVAPPPHLRARELGGGLEESELS